MVVAQYHNVDITISISISRYHNIKISISQYCNINWGKGCDGGWGRDGWLLHNITGCSRKCKLQREYVQTALQLNANLLPTYFLANILNSLSKIFLIIRQIYDWRLLLKNDDDSVNNDDDDCGGDDDEVNACSLNIVQWSKFSFAFCARVRVNSNQCTCYPCLSFLDYSINLTFASPIINR